jgi:hypothetical protein
MGAPLYLSVGTATPTVSPAFTFPFAPRNIVLEVPSLTAASEIRPQFSATSGGPFWTLQRGDGTGAPFAVHSGAGPAIGAFTPPTPFGRFVLTGSVTMITTLTLYPGGPR